MAKQQTHSCSKEAIITKIEHAVLGNDKPGLILDMALAHEKLDTIASMLNFFKWGIAISITIAVGWGTIIVSDHFTVKKMPDEYAKKEYLLQVLVEFQQQTQILENAQINTKEDVIELRKALNENNEFIRRFTTTRGTTQKETFTK